MRENDQGKVREDAGERSVETATDKVPVSFSMLKDDPIVSFVLRQKKHFISGLLLLLIVVFAFFVRWDTFWLPHWMGDQSHYVSLAMKLDLFGFEHYSLRGVNVGSVGIDKENKVRLVYPKPAKDITSKGQILSGMEMAGIRYYDQPFFHKPPAFPFMLMISHKLFARNKQLYPVVLTNIGSFLHKMKVRPKVFFDGQFYAVIVPLTFSLGLVICTFFIGKLLFSYRVGLYAAFLMSIHPVGVMTCQKLWADDMVAFFVALAVAICILSFKQKKNWLMLLSGAACGVSVLAKQSGGYLVFGMIPFILITHRPPRKSDKYDIEYFKSLVLDPRMYFFAAGVILTCGFWFLKIYQIFGDPLFRPGQTDLLKKDITGWFSYLMARPKGAILYLVGIPYLCPLFGLSLLSLKKFVTEFMRSIQKKTYDYRVLILWIVILSFYINLRSNREHRLMLPTYPMLAVLAACSLEKFRHYSGKFSAYLGSKKIRQIFIIVLLLLCAFWSVPIGIKTGLKEIILLKIPF